MDLLKRYYFKLIWVPDLKVTSDGQHDGRVMFKRESPTEEMLSLIFGHLTQHRKHSFCQT